jgi:23S rRNA (uridine2552-2'-O)-methyltransferase
VKAADQAAAMALVDLATHAALRWLNPGGHLVVKMFQGEGVDDWVRARRQEFDKVSLAKPEASRAGSRELYGVAFGLRQSGGSVG